MKQTKCLIAILMFFAMGSCKKEAYKQYSDTARVQFGPDITRIYQPSYNLADTTKGFTFVYNLPASTQDTVWFDVYAVGDISANDRTFNLLQIADTTGATNALPAVDYKSFTDPTVAGKYKIKAGETHTLAPIVLLRSANLKTTSVTLLFKIVASADFQPGETANLWRKITFTDRLSKPAAWTSTINIYFGTYSITKHQFMIDVTGQKWDQAFLSGVLSDFTALIYYTNVCKTALINYNNAHPGNPMRDENGVLVVFP
jgi:hypothetical protein